jgi:hypothetical protein
MQEILSDNFSEGRDSELLIAEATFEIFKVGKLITSAVCYHVLDCWAPVLLNRDLNLYAEPYKAHFGALYKVVIDKCATFPKRIRLISRVVDFSVAQKKDPFWLLKSILMK